MFINMGDEIINIDNIKCFFIESNSVNIESFDGVVTFETFESEDEAIEQIEVIAEELKKQGLLIEV